MDGGHGMDYASCFLLSRGHRVDVAGVESYLLNVLNILLYICILLYRAVHESLQL
jgi:hypothetical protein